MPADLPPPPPASSGPTAATAPPLPLPKTIRRSYTAAATQQFYESMNEGYASPMSMTLASSSSSSSSSTRNDQDIFGGLGSNVWSGLAFVPSLLMTPAMSAVSSVSSNVGSAVSKNILGMSELEVMHGSAESALVYLSQNQELTNLVALLRHTEKLFSRAKLSCISQELRKRVFHVAIFLSQVSSSRMTLQRQQVIPLENVLSSGIKYFHRFCSDDFPRFLLCGREPERRVKQFNDQIVRVCMIIAHAVGMVTDANMTEHYLFPAINTAVVCDVKSSVLKAMTDPESLSRYLSNNERGLGLGLEYEREVKKTHSLIQEITEQSVYMTTFTPQNMLRHQGLRHFWLVSFGTRTSVSLAEFSSAARTYLQEVNGKEASAALTITKKFEEIAVTSKLAMFSHETGGDLVCPPLNLPQSLTLTLMVIMLIMVMLMLMQVQI